MSNCFKCFQGYLSEDSLAGVKKLLPDHAQGELANVCSWADEVRFHYHYRWSSPLHYVDTPDFRCNYKYCSKLQCLLYIYIYIVRSFLIFNNFLKCTFSDVKSVKEPLLSTS